MNDDKNAVHGEKKGSSLTGSDYEKLLENLPSNLCFLIHHVTRDHTVKIWEFFFLIYIVS